LGERSYASLPLPRQRFAVHLSAAFDVEVADILSPGANPLRVQIHEVVSWSVKHGLTDRLLKILETNL
jgi:hypothetical protein